MDQNNNPAPRPFFSFGPGMRVWLIVALLFSGMGVFTMLSKSSSFMWLAAGPDSGYAVSTLRWGLVVIQALFFLMPAVVFANVFPAERFGFFRMGVKVKPLLLILGVLSIVLLLPGLNWLGDVCYRAITNPDLKAMEETNAQKDAWMDVIPNIQTLFFCIFISALVPAICEELFFRACLQQTMKEWMKNRHPAIILTSLFFAVVHFSPAGFFPILIAGLMLGYAFDLTGSLRTNIAMHFFFNATSLIIDYLNQHSKAVADWQEPVWVDVVSLFVGSAFFALIILRVKASKQKTVSSRQ